MTEQINQEFPKDYIAINESTTLAGFSMASDINTCSLLSTLAASKPGGEFLELGTGTGLSTSWILAGMSKSSTLISLDNDETYLGIAHHFLGGDSRLNLICIDGAEWIAEHKNRKFDYIFADTWHGKYLMLDEVLDMIKPGGLYIIDDMLPQSNWPDGHQEKAELLIEYLEQRKDLILTKQCWATGIIIAVKRAS